MSFSAITPATATRNRYVTILALATLGGVTQIGSFRLIVTAKGGQGKHCHVSPSLASSPTNVANVDEPLEEWFFSRQCWRLFRCWQRKPFCGPSIGRNVSTGQSLLPDDSQQKGQPEGRNVSKAVFPLAKDSVIITPSIMQVTATRDSHHCTCLCPPWV